MVDDVVKFLCMCEYGHSRSVALARAFHAKNYAAVAMGRSTSGRAPWLLGDWATLIVAMAPNITPPVYPWPLLMRKKIILFDIGPDRWSNPYHPELRKLCEDKVPELIERAEAILRERYKNA